MYESSMEETVKDNFFLDFMDKYCIFQLMKFPGRAVWGSENPFIDLLLKE